MVFALYSRRAAVGTELHGGRVVDDALRDRVVGITGEQLRAIPRRVGIAGGPRKRETIRAAVAGGLVNVLITDLTTARWMLDSVRSRD